jgi:hypothetical protein
MSARADYASLQQERQPMTADVIYWNGAKISALDCAIFVPNIDAATGAGSTQYLVKALKKKGYSANIVDYLDIQKFSQSDSNGHRVDEYRTDVDAKNLNRNGVGTLYLTLAGIRSTILKKHRFILSLNLIGRSGEIAQSMKSGTLGQATLTVQDLPVCQPK